VLLLVVELPDGSPGTVRADVTDVLPLPASESSRLVVDGEGIRRLHGLIVPLRSRRGPRRDGK
jgi:hypothetical protein